MSWSALLVSYPGSFSTARQRRPQTHSSSRDLTIRIDAHETLHADQNALQPLRTRPLLARVAAPCPEYTQAHLALSIDVGVEARAAAIGGDAFDVRALQRVVFGELDIEFEEAKLVWCVWWADDQGAQAADVGVTAGDGEGEVASFLDVGELLRYAVDC